ncbi:MAG: hypothetical protein LBI33_07925 [Propionibacteriaceae bacterium]|nr:hypothetical protein [Propionibacteriaceae bacterium]
MAGLWKRALTLAVAKPGIAFTTTATALVTIVVYGVVPGLIPVFGIGLPLWLTTRYVLATGVLAGTTTPTVQPR